MKPSSKLTYIATVVFFSATCLCMGLAGVVFRRVGTITPITGDDAVAIGWPWVCFGIALIVLAWRIHVWYEDD